MYHKYALMIEIIEFKPHLNHLIHSMGTTYVDLHKLENSFMP